MIAKENKITPLLPTTNKKGTILMQTLAV